MVPHKNFTKLYFLILLGWILSFSLKKLLNNGYRPANGKRRINLQPTFNQKNINVYTFEQHSTMNYGAHHEGMRGQNFCIIERCMKKTGQLFPVPHKNSSVFNKWIRIVSLSGYPGHRICGDHFKPDDFLIGKFFGVYERKWDLQFCLFAVKRVKLKPASVPSILPNRADKFSLKPGCCVKGCKSRKRQLLQKFPPARSSRRKLWNLALGLPKGERRSLKICHLHFKTSDFVQSKYSLAS